MSTPSGFRYKRIDSQIRGVVVDLEGIFFDHGLHTMQEAMKQAFQAKGIEIDAETMRTTTPDTHPKDATLKVGLLRALAEKFNEKAARTSGSAQANGSTKTTTAANGERSPGAPSKQAHLSTAWLIPQLVQEFDAAYLKEGKSCKPIQRAVDTLKHLTESGVKLGMIADCTSEMMELYSVRAKYYGFLPDVFVSTSTCAPKAPQPWAIFACLKEMGVFPPSSVVRVTTTVEGVEEGLNAGCIVVGVARTGLYVSESSSVDLDAPIAKDVENRSREAAEQLWRAGAHHVIEGIWELPAALTELGTLKRLSHLQI
uniref:Uncharacterized protein n=1 Tax=Chromera velia CCMP2878 TaxID=1169474 RepID=A0A0G4I9Q4_9ALVE|eukprot:Cvel_12329.t1-p1 / transcript=Cvel_12329.t1 / gene=Cvel_12329 / organism=Chromera_velia_CCMP2878 / gene_product=Phosphonoacetaldehyde hydrolase, putative / transcript_product=Phosphonoacetaldehyde hydrolase, putative / location=Cvel_scaffold802:34277-41287(-) / protein_length=312 / sequence_SO=supercontig / SO=protein_coding / is_pseudo=false